MINVRSHKLDIEVPAGLPEQLEKILDESVSCYEIGCFASSVVMAGLLMEGALKESNIAGNSLFEMINNAQNSKKISQLTFHMATASRMMRNKGAHYSEGLAKIDDSEARLTIEMARKLVVDLLDSESI